MTSQSQAVTPVRVPKAATAYTPATQDPDLRSQINTLLLREGHVEKIEQALHHALHAHPSNWPQKVSLHALSLLRSGECTTFPKLIERVLSDIRRDTEEARLNHLNPSPVVAPLSNSSNSSSTMGSSKASTTTSTASGSGPEQQRKAKTAKANSAGGPNALGKGKGAMGTGAGATKGVVNGVAGTGERNTGLAVPQLVIEEGVRITRECLEQVCEVDQ